MYCIYLTKNKSRNIFLKLDYFWIDSTPETPLSEVKSKGLRI